MIEELKTIDCPHGGGAACLKCVSMCASRPCWGTPDDARKLIAAGYGPRLMRDYWVVVEDDQDIHLLSPAIVGREGQGAPFWPSGCCTFLTEDGLCELHNLGLKPTEGRVANCQGGDADTPSGLSLHKEVAYAWDSPEAQALVEEWEIDHGDGGHA